MNSKKIAFIISSYAIWALLAVGSFFLMFSGRTALLAALARYADSGFSQRMLVGTLDKAYMIGAGLLILGYCIGIERYVTIARSWMDLGGRSLKALGIEAFALFASTLTIQLAARTFFASFVFAFTLLLPLIAAVASFVGGTVLRRKAIRRLKDDDELD